MGTLVFVKDETLVLSALTLFNLLILDKKLGDTREIDEPQSIKKQAFAFSHLPFTKICETVFSLLLGLKFP